MEELVFVTPIEDQTVNTIPGTATFECEISKPGVPAKWKRGDKVVKSGDKYEITAEGGVHRLVVKNVTGDDEDDYSVQFGEVTSAAKLFVKGKFCISCRNIDLPN